MNDVQKPGISKELYDDDVYNGNNVELKWSNNVYQQNDTVVVELYSLDKNTYEY